MSVQSIITTLVAATMLVVAFDAAAQSAPATNAPVSVTDSPQRPAAPATTQPAAPAAPAQPAPVVAPRESEPLPEIENTPLGGKSVQVGDPESLPGTGVGSWGLQTAMALGVVVMLIVLVRLFLKRLHGNTAASSAGLVEVMARVPIAPKTSVLFLRIGQRIIIAGQTQAGLNTLAEFDDPDDVAEVLAHVEAAKPASITEGFGKLMKQFDRGYDAETDDEGGDRDEHVVDRTRNDVTGLLTRIRSLNKDDDPPR